MPHPCMKVRKILDATMEFSEYYEDREKKSYSYKRRLIKVKG